MKYFYIISYGKSFFNYFFWYVIIHNKKQKAVALDFNKCNSFYFSNCVNSYTFTFSFRKKLSFVSLITIPINITTKPQTILGVICSSG